MHQEPTILYPPTDMPEITVVYLLIVLSKKLHFKKLPKKGFKISDQVLKRWPKQKSFLHIKMLSLFA